MSYFWHLATIVGMSLPGVLGYNLIFGRGKVLHFGPVGIGVVTAYAIFLTERVTHSFLIALPVGLVVYLAISALFAWMSLRLAGDALGILTIAMHLAFVAVVLNWTDLTRGALGLAQIRRMPGLESPQVFGIVSLVVGFGFALCMAWVDRSKLGRSLSALAENRFHAESLGISRVSAIFAAFLIGGLGSFLTNVLFPQYVQLLHPNDYAFRFLIFWLMCIVAGGPGNVFGVTLATVVLTLLQEGLRFVPLPFGLIGPIRLLMFGVILVVAVYVRRKELFPQPRSV